MVAIVGFLLGKFFVYFLLSIITSSLVEMILASFSLRYKVLRSWLKRTFGITLGDAILHHKILYEMSAISGKNFVSALLEKITYREDDSKSVESNLDEIIITLKNSTIIPTELKRVFLQYAYEAKESNSGNELKYFRTELETWFDTSMDTLSGSLKKKYVFPITFLVVASVVCALNVDSIQFVKMLYGSSTESGKIMEQYVSNKTDSVLLNTVNLLKPSSRNDSIIIEGVRNHLNTEIKKHAEQQLENKKKEELESFSIGWHTEQLKENGAYSINKIVEKGLGLFATIPIIMLLAPFLFNLGNKYLDAPGA